MNSGVIRSYWLAAILTLVASTAIAGTDIARDVRGETAAGDGGYLEFSMGLYTYDSPIVGDIDESFRFYTNGRYQWNGLFVELFSDSYNGLNLGYNFWNPGDWSLDFIVSQQNGIESSRSNGIDSIEELDSLRDRDSGFSVGLRATGYLDDYILQMSVVGDDLDGNHDGHIASVFLGRHWQVRNWNFHGLLGAEYQSDEVIDYYFGVRDYEASEQFMTYRAGAGTRHSIEVGASYPISENWVFRSTARYVLLPDSVVDSPLTNDDSVSFLSVNISYVF